MAANDINMDKYLDDLIMNPKCLLVSKQLQIDAESIASQVMSSVAAMDNRFCCSIVGTGSCFEGTLVTSSEFDFDFILPLEGATNFVMDEFLGKCGFVELKFLDGKSFSGEEFMNLVDGGRVLNDSYKKDWDKKGLFAQLTEDASKTVNLPSGWSTQRNEKGRIIEDNGPAVTMYFLYNDVVTSSSYSVSIDLVLAIKLLYVPAQIDWLHRLPKEYPLYMQMIHILKSSQCYAVMKRLSFRISLSVMEMKLFELFPHIRDVYKIAKTLRNAFLKDSQGKKWLSSYVLKTAVFYELECYPSEEDWNKDQNIVRLRNIFAFILNGLFREHLSHFFISHKNILESENLWFISQHNRNPLNREPVPDRKERTIPINFESQDDSCIQAVMQLYLSLLKDKWSPKEGIEIGKIAQSSTADAEQQSKTHEKLSSAAFEFFYQESLKMLYESQPWRELQIEHLRMRNLGELSRQKMVKIMISRSTGVKELGYLKYNLPPSRWVANKFVFAPKKVFTFGLFSTPVLIVTKEVIDNIALQLQTVLSTKPSPDPTKIKDIDYEICLFNKKEEGVGDVTYGTRYDTTYYWSHYVKWEKSKGKIVASEKEMATITIVYHD